MKASMIRFALALVFYWYEFLVRVAPGPMFKSLMVDLNLDAQAFGLLSSSFLLPYALLQIPCGLLLDRIPTGRVLLVSCLICVLSTLGFSLAHNYFLLVFWRTLSGVGSAVAVLACMKIAISEFPKSYFGIFAGVILFVGGLGAISGKILLSICLKYYAWREIMAFLGIAGLVLCGFILYYFDLSSYPDQSESEADSSVFSSLMQLLSNPINCIFGLYALLMTAPSDAFAGLWSSVFFAQVYNFESVTVELLGSMIFIGMALGSPIVTSIDHYLKKSFSLAAALALASAVLFYSIAYSHTLPVYTLCVLSLLYGVVSVYVLAFVMAQSFNDTKISGLVSGFINTASIVGSFSLQTVIGSLMTYHEPNPKLDAGQLIYHYSTFQKSLSIIVVFYIISMILMTISAMTIKSQSECLNESS